MLVACPCRFPTIFVACPCKLPTIFPACPCKLPTIFPACPCKLLLIEATLLVKFLTILVPTSFNLTPLKLFLIESTLVSFKKLFKSVTLDFFVPNSLTKTKSFKGEVLKREFISFTNEAPPFFASISSLFLLNSEIALKAFIEDCDKNVNFSPNLVEIISTINGTGPLSNFNKLLIAGTNLVNILTNTLIKTPITPIACGSL